MNSGRPLAKSVTWSINPAHRLVIKTTSGTFLHPTIPQASRKHLCVDTNIHDQPTFLVWCRRARRDTKRQDSTSYWFVYACPQDEPSKQNPVVT
ncbi:unnamed protein product [Chondrus crispus]|uniref:Uncharacterized protein n=1 Tax=Chondrus crispus TaxID=2769 RepID=R7QA08_CHOCR|nr:unnamed protein product [Chondrus crispus]CDF34246.1 unnamed protein product [Chondrus crispus]|eukprot:XP_005714065.1 unnamed protein product [Chondrus crispus]